jgi:hypothetical protein
MILVGSGSVHNMDYISDDAKVARRHAEITSVVRRRRWNDEENWSKGEYPGNRPKRK